jgi:hypothetical protein
MSEMRYCINRPIYLRNETFMPLDSCIQLQNREERDRVWYNKQSKLVK